MIKELLGVVLMSGGLGLMASGEYAGTWAALGAASFIFGLKLFGDARWAKQSNKGEEQ